MLFVSKIEAMFATGSLKWNRAINEKDRVIGIVFSRSSVKIDPRSCLFLLVQALYVEDRSSRDRRWHTANIVHHQAESPFHQPNVIRISI